MAPKILDHLESYRPVLAAVLLATFAGPVTAQEHPALERGFSPDKLYQFSQIDQVSIFNNALSINIPIGSYPAGGDLSYSLNLSFTSKFWDFEEVMMEGNNADFFTRALPAQHSNAGLGWAVQLGRLLSPNAPTNDTPFWQYLDPTWGRHAFYGTAPPRRPGRGGLFLHAATVPTCAWPL